MNLVLASARIEGYRAGRDDMSRAEIRKLTSMVQSWAMARDLTQDDNGNFSVATDAGRMRLSIDGTFGTVFCRFVEAELAHHIDASVNPYSGKFNHHFGKVSALEAYSQFRCRIDRFVRGIEG